VCTVADRHIKLLCLIVLKIAGQEMVATQRTAHEMLLVAQHRVGALVFYRKQGCVLTPCLAIHACLIINPAKL
jgi:hypothetical protein